MNQRGQPSSRRREDDEGYQARPSEQKADVRILCKKLGLENQKSNTCSHKQIYKLTHIIGEGTYGVVHRGVDTRSNRMVAIKQMALDPDGQGLPSVALREITHLGQMDHKNIVNMLDLVVAEKHMMVVFEYLDMDLRQYQNNQMKKVKYLPFETIRLFLCQMLQGLSYIHSCSVIHRDMKPQNVLVDVKNMVVKIGDFGLARIYTVPLREMTNEVVTLWYRAPELLLGTELYTTSTDVWSLAVMFIELMENNCPFNPDCEIRALHMIFQALGTPNALTWPDFANQKHFCDAFPKWAAKSWKEISPHAPPLAIELLKLMLVYDPSKRISCDEALCYKDFFKAHIDQRLMDEPDTSPSGLRLNPLSPRTPVSFKKTKLTPTSAH
ncbi:hypothetical protein RvY_09550 [Ramazzottius varieornatus]|uniref:cyclin-dependent kinase n=1 Tax=Ramazzottius varieornatus TaxID=947166 RepID=A0A1D1V9R4_RAMVA|nr:hypothetical protein RvY_09550 [Ramazzottius varieornatus]